jgi:hypothetical protein
MVMPDLFYGSKSATGMRAELAAGCHEVAAPKDRNRGVLPPVRCVRIKGRISVDLQHLVHHVDQPVVRDLRPGIQAALVVARSRGKVASATSSTSGGQDGCVAM